jgi:DNA-binding SARP family transcriptional activator/tetratricopeptide (TPR) repeat protein
MAKQAGPVVRLRVLGEASISMPLARIDPSAEIIFAATLYLIVERGDPVSRRTIQALLWPSASDSVASHRLRQTLLKLRRLGFPIDLKNKGNISVAAEAVSVDFEEFLAARKGVDFRSNDALVMLPAYEPRFSAPYLEWIDALKAKVNASMTRVMLGIIAGHRVKGEWVEAELNASRLLRFQPYNEEATLAMAEACAMRGGKLDAMHILDRYLSEVGSGPTDLRLPATIMRRRIADRMHPRAEAVVGESPLVGRGAMMERLGELLERCRDRRGEACLVWGDAGVGKSRLLGEFATFASLRGIPTQRVQCRPSDPHRPLSVFVDLVPGLRNMRGAIGCSPETFTYLDRLTRHKPTKIEVKAAEGDAEFVYAKVQQSLFDLVDAVSDEGCLIILIEDVHWIDSTSAKLLREMVAWAAEHSILFAFTGRDQPEGWLAGMPPRLEEIHLPPLEPGPSRDVVLGVVRQHGREIDDQYLDWCVRVAEGNPYFLQELANHWIESGGQRKVPASLAAVLNARISRLARDTLYLLQTCAVLEKNSTLERIEKVLGYESHQMLRAINELGSAGMLVIEAGEPGTGVADRFSSRHDLLSNAALARLTAPALAFLHRRAGAVLEKEIDEHRSTAILWDCAKHWQLAGELGRALDLARSCATHLMAEGLPNAAADAYEKSLAYCGTGDERLETLEGLAHAYYRSSAWERVSEVVRKAREVMLTIHPNRDLHDDLELMALRAEWRTLRWERTLQKALACLKEEKATPNHRVEAGGMALMLLDQTCAHDVMPSVYEILEHLSTKPGVTLAAKLQATVVYHTVCGSLETAVESARALISEQRKTGNIGDLFRSLCNAAVPMRTAGVFDEAESVLLEALSIAEEHKIDLALSRALPMLANMALERGLDSDATRWLELLRAHPSTPHDKYVAIEIAGIGVRLALLSNRPEEARKLLPRRLQAFKHDPAVFRRTYQAALYVATELASGRIPSEASLRVLKDSHLHSRRTTHQAFAAYALYVGLKAAGKKRQAHKLLTEYLTTYRREPWPAPTHLLTTLERSCSN